MDLIEPPDSPFRDYQMALASIEATLDCSKGPLAEMFTVDARCLLEIAEVAFGILRHDEFCSVERTLLEHSFDNLASAVMPI